MRSPVLAAALAATLMAGGCGQFKAAPLISPSEFPNALRGIEKHLDSIVAAFDARTPWAADGPFHKIAPLLGMAERLAKPAGLDNDQAFVLSKSIRKFESAMSQVHVYMHGEALPDDFDFEPIREQIKQGIAELRGVISASLAADLEEAQQERDAERAADAAQGPAPDTGAAVPAEPQAFSTRQSLTAATRLAPLCPSVMLWDNASRELAPERVNRAAELLDGVPPDRRWVQLVPTLHARLNGDLTIAEYGVMLDRRASWQTADNFEAADDGLADRLRDAFAGAIGQAVRRGLHVAILPHLDPAAGLEEWRNNYRFAPGAQIGAGSYESLLLEPLADAIEAEANPDTRIDLALSGEMGGSLFEHPREYLALLRRLRERFSKNPRTPGVRIGVSLNWDGPAAAAKQQVIPADAVELLSACDFLGVSCYAPVDLPPKENDFRQALIRFLGEINALSGGETRRALPLQISEVGLGGGRRGFDPADAVAAAPYEGLGHPNHDPWEPGELLWLRREYHNALCDYLASGEVERAFLWSEGPWDPQGVADPRFRDEQIAAAILRHNQSVSP